MNAAVGYEQLENVLGRAFRQAAEGKGAERHADGKPFHEQPMQRLCDLYGVGFALGQAGKKMQEAQRMTTDAAVRELLGAIVYAAGAIVFLERQQAPVPANDNAMACQAPGSEGKRPCPQCVRAGQCKADAVAGVGVDG